MRPSRSRWPLWSRGPMRGGRSEGSGSMYQRGSEGKNDVWVCPVPDIVEVTAGRRDAELERPLPRVDGVEVSPLGQDLARQPLEVGNMTGGNDVVRVQTIQRERQPAATGLDDGHPERREHPEDPTADEGPERGHARPWIRKAVKQEPSAVQIERARPVGWPRRPAVGEQRQVEVLGHFVEGIEVGVVEQLAPPR